MLCCLLGPTSPQPRTQPTPTCRTRDLRRSGAPDGAAFSDWVWWPSSLKAHQLLQLAQQRGLGREAKELLLLWTYERGLNISETDTLVEAAQQLGMQGEEVRRYLERDQGLQAVLQEDAEAKQQLRIGGVPYFVLSLAGEGGQGPQPRQHALSGAQPVAAFERVVKRLLAEQQ